MLDNGGRLVNDVPASQTHPPAEVGVLIVDEEGVIKCADVLQHAACQEYCTAAGGEHLLSRVELMPIVLPGPPVAPAAVCQDQAPGVLNHARAVHIDQFGGNGAYCRVRLGHSNQGSKPAEPNPRVVVEEHHVFAPSVAKPEVVASR